MAGLWSLFNRLESKRKRVIGERQIEILKVLLEEGDFAAEDLYDKKVFFAYKSVKNGLTAFARDVLQLANLQAIKISADFEWLSINLDWPQQIDEGEFFRKMKAVPQGRRFKFLS